MCGYSPSSNSSTTQAPNSEFVDLASVIEAVLDVAAEAIWNHRQRDFPIEAVGIVFSDGSTQPLINQLRSETAYAVNPLFVEEAFAEGDARGVVPLAFYHTHPKAEARPSLHDIDMMEQLPGAPFVIAGTDGIKTWVWEDGQAKQLTETDV